MRRAATALFWLLLTLWVAASIAPALAAINSFITLPTLGVRLPEFESYAHGDSEVMGRIAAGESLQPLFAATEVAQEILAPITILAALLAFRGFGAKRASAAQLALGLGLLLAAFMTASQAALAPRSLAALNTYWALARTGATADANTAKASFDALHWWSQRLSETRLAALLLSVLAGGLLVSRRGEGETP